MTSASPNTSVSDSIDRLIEGLPPLLTVSQVCKVIYASRQSVMRMISAGQLDALNMGAGSTNSSYRVTRDSVERFLRSRVIVPSRGW